MVQSDTFAVHHIPFGYSTQRGGDNMCGENKDPAEQEKLKATMQSYLERMCGQGIGLYMDDRTVAPGVAAERCVREDSAYMSDFVYDDAGRILQIRFDRVENN